MNKSFKPSEIYQLLTIVKPEKFGLSTIDESTHLHWININMKFAVIKFWALRSE